MFKQKELYWLRGGFKKEWVADNDDFERPLDARGKKQVYRIQDYLKRHPEIHPQLIFCSKSQRARQFLQIVTDVLPSTHLIYHHFLYLASGYSVLEIIENVDEQVDSILVLGHTKALNELPLLMSINGITTNKLIVKDLGHGAFVHLTFDEGIHWRDIHVKKAQLKDIFYP